MQITYDPWPDENNELGSGYGIGLISEGDTQTRNIAQYRDFGFSSRFFLLNQATQRQSLGILDDNRGFHLALPNCW